MKAGWWECSQRVYSLLSRGVYSSFVCQLVSRSPMSFILGE